MVSNTTNIQREEGDVINFIVGLCFGFLVGVIAALGNTAIKQKHKVRELINCIETDCQNATSIGEKSKYG